MSLIQKIRDKYARIAVIAIALSLLGFILMDAFAGRTGLFGNSGPSSSLGSVNGISIDRAGFDSKTKNMENYYQSKGYPINDETRFQIMQQTWDQEVGDVLLNEEYEKLGLTVTEKELRDVLYGANPPQFIAQAFTDPKTGKFDGIAAQQQVNKLLKSGTLEQKNYINEQIDAAKKQRLMAKYTAMLMNTIYFPKWFLEKRNVDNSLLGKAAFVSIPYSTIPDSTIKISDDEIKSYIKDHKEEFEQKEETRSINYVMFNASPSAADSAATRAEVDTLRSQFAAATDLTTFLGRQSAFPYNDAYLAKSAIQVPVKDTLFKLPKDGIFGPYLDGSHYVLARMVDMKSMPDSAKAKHILIGTNDPQTGQQLLPDSVAKNRIDSIERAIRGGANFDTLAKQLSTDKGSAEKGGLLQIQNPQTGEMSDYFTQGQMVKAFNDTVFNGQAGQKKVVKSEFGYHLIQILDLKSIEPHYKIAYLAKPITASDQTDEMALNEANTFAGDSRDLATFNSAADKLRAKGINKFPATDLSPMSSNLMGVPGSARSFIKKIFDADKGSIIGPERVGENYVVGVVTEVNEPGTQSVATVRPRVEPLLRKKKQGEQIIKNLGSITTLEAVATKMGQPVQPLDSVRFGGSQYGFEPKLIGAIFNPANRGKVVPEAIPGMQAVYVLRVDNVTTTPVDAASIDDQRKMLEMQAKQSFYGQMQQGANPIVDMLKKSAKIKDKRSSVY